LEGEKMKQIKLQGPLILNKTPYQAGEVVEVSDEVYEWLMAQYISKRKEEVAKILETEAIIETYKSTESE
jgi:hypothetical protein